MYFSKYHTQLYIEVIVCISCQFKVIPVYLLPVLMVYVGLLGGASYVNIFYMLLHDDKYPARDRELCINITAMFITLGQYCYFVWSRRTLTVAESPPTHCAIVVMCTNVRLNRGHDPHAVTVTGTVLHICNKLAPN